MGAAQVLMLASFFLRGVGDRIYPVLVHRFRVPSSRVELRDRVPGPVGELLSAAGPRVPPSAGAQQWQGTRPVWSSRPLGRPRVSDRGAQPPPPRGRRGLRTASLPATCATPP